MENPHPLNSEGAAPGVTGSISRTWGAAVLRPYMSEDGRRMAVELEWGFILGFWLRLLR
jgi:hypothetical protein